MPGTAKVRGLNLTRTFQTGNILFQIKLSANCFFCLSVVDSVVICWNRFFFGCALFSLMLP